MPNKRNIEQLEELTGLFKDSEYLVDNPNRRCPNITKARKSLGFNPKINPHEGVKRYLLFLKNTL